MTGTFLSAWLLFPATLLLCSVGCGLFVRRLGGGLLAPVLILPVGFALIIAVCAFLTSYAATAPAAGVVVAVLAFAGVALELRSRRLDAKAATEAIRHRSSRWIWPALAAIVAFAAVGGPVFLTGTPTWTGYTRIVDIAFQMDFANYLAHAGRVTPNLGSSYNAMIYKLTTAGYPGGGQATLGSIARLVGTEVPWCYQAYLAFAAAMGTLAIYALLGALTTSGLMCAIGAAVAIQPNALYSYVLVGGIKELTAAVSIMLVVALLVRRLPGDGPRRSVVPVGVALSAAAAAFSFGILPWLGIVFAGLLAVTFRRGAHRRHTAESWGLLAAVAVVLSIPTLITAIKLLSIAGQAFGGVIELGLGNLGAPVPDWSSAGVWLTADYRFPLTHVAVTHGFDILVIVFALLGVALALRMRRWALGLFGVSVPIALYYWIAHTGPWIQFKAFCITGMMSLAIAFVGAAALRDASHRWIRWLGWLAAATIAAVVLYGNALTYHDISLAPAARYRNLAAIGKRFAGKGPTLFPEFDEYAEYFLREARATDLVNPAYARFPLARGVTPPATGVSFSWKLNQISQSFLQKFPLIVLPRDPVAERPPSNYELVEQSRYFQVWRRDAPSSAILSFSPLAGGSRERTETKFCTPFLAAVRRAGPSAEIAYAKPSEVLVTGLTLGEHPSYWQPIGPDSLLAHGAGTATVKVKVPKDGHYSIWMEASVGRPLEIYLDGHKLETLGYEERYPGQFLEFGKAQLSSGTHTLRVARGNGTLHPGSGDGATDGEVRTLGAIVFQREDADTNRVYVASTSAAVRVCSAPVGYQWLEIIKPGGAPRDATKVKG